MAESRRANGREGKRNRVVGKAENQVEGKGQPEGRAEEEGEQVRGRPSKGGVRAGQRAEGEAVEPRPLEMGRWKGPRTMLRG